MDLHLPGAAQVNGRYRFKDGVVYRLDDLSQFEMLTEHMLDVDCLLEIRCFLCQVGYSRAPLLSLRRTTADHPCYRRMVLIILNNFKGLRCSF